MRTNERQMVGLFKTELIILIVALVLIGTIGATGVYLLENATDVITVTALSMMFLFLFGGWTCGILFTLDKLKRRKMLRLEA